MAELPSCRDRADNTAIQTGPNKCCHNSAPQKELNSWISLLLSPRFNTALKFTLTPYLLFTGIQVYTQSSIPVLAALGQCWRYSLQHPSPPSPWSWPYATHTDSSFVPNLIKHHNLSGPQLAPPSTQPSTQLPAEPVVGTRRLVTALCWPVCIAQSFITCNPSTTALRRARSSGSSQTSQHTTHHLLLKFLSKFWVEPGVDDPYGSLPVWDILWFPFLSMQKWLWFLIKLDPIRSSSDSIATLSSSALHHTLQFIIDFRLYQEQRNWDCSLVPSGSEPHTQPQDGCPLPYMGEVWLESFGWLGRTTAVIS